MSPIIGTIMLLALSLFVLAFAIRKFRPGCLLGLDDKETRQILSNVSVLFTAGLVGYVVYLFVDFVGQLTGQVSWLVTILVLELIAFFILLGAVVSVFIFKGLKWIFKEE